MGPLDTLFHLLSFAAPALATGFGVALAARLFFAQQLAGRSLWGFVAINSIAGLIALLGGLLYFGVDGKMFTYAALVVCAATSQWLAGRAWKA
jgi:hypothetical protein